MVQSQVILVGGGTGFVGRHLVDLLRKGGAKVRILTRRPGSSSDQISWDTIKRKGLPSDTTAVVNLAGRNLLEPGLWTENYKKEVYSSRIETNKLLANAINAATNKPRSFVTVSGVGYYPTGANSETTEYDEEWQPKATTNDKHQDSFLTKLARDWEAASKLDEEAMAKTRRVIIRAGVVIGPDGGIIANMMLPFKLGLGGPIGDGQQWLPWIHVDDLANMFKFSILNDHVEGIVNGVAPEQVKNKQFADLFAKSLSRPSFLPLPGFAVNLMFGSERAPVLLQGQRVKSRAGLIGFRYQYPTLESAINACSTSH
uniref:Epimerase family protein SDR39U1 n=1 Tax=Aceria tosichella TaxID=561515 RepID=A0A6G1SCB5_9ACAR